jgi:3-oxoacyl-[acyl-carrier protein] reductase
MSEQRGNRPLALVTGAGRRAGIAAAVCLDLATDGWDVAFTYWRPYDQRMAWGSDTEGPALLTESLRAAGARTVSVEVDLSRIDSVPQLFDAVEPALGPVSALVIGHCESVDSDIRSTTVESFDLHMAVNARAAWLLVRELAARYRAAFGAGRIVALTSDATVRNLPYGASKGALDRIVLAAARELAELGITANVVDPGPVDTGWMSAELAEAVVAGTPLRRLGTPADVAALVTFLCSARGGWVNGQLLHSDGGLHS